MLFRGVMHLQSAIIAIVVDAYHVDVSSLTIEFVSEHSLKVEHALIFVFLHCSCVGGLELEVVVLRLGVPPVDAPVWIVLHSCGATATCVIYPQGLSSCPHWFFTCICMTGMAK